MGLGGFLKDIGHAAASGVHDVSSALNVVDRYINPFHVEAGSTRTGDTSGNSPLGTAVVQHVVNPSLEHVSQGMNWLYDNGISQPISTALMAGELPGGPFSAHNWTQAWHAAEHISPAQALFLNSGQTQRAVNSPLLYYKPAAAYLPPGFDQLPQDQQEDFLRRAGMPAVGNAYIQELRQTHRYFANASGVGDFALRWWADPTILAGKAVGAARQARQVVRAPAVGLSRSDIDKIMSKSVMGKAQDYIWQNRDNPALLNNLAMAQKSAMGPRFGAIASLLKSPDEVHDFLRVGLGDIDAIERLQMKNTLAASRIQQDTERLSALGEQFTRYAHNPNYQAIVQQHMDSTTARINADTDLVRRYNGVLDHANELDQVNLSRWSFARAQARTDAQAAYRASTARGAAAGSVGRRVTITPTPIFSRGTSAPVDLGVAKTPIFGVGDFFSSPVTLVRSFANSRPNGYMRIDDVDRDSMAELRGQLARIPGISDQSRLNALNEYVKAPDEHARLRILNEIGGLGAAKVAEKHGLDPEMGRELYQAHLTKQFGEKDNMRRYSAAKAPIQLSDGSFARVHVDEFADDGGKLVVAPNLVTKIQNSHVFQDLDEMDKVMARHSSALSAIRTSRFGNPDWLIDAADYVTHLFKFGTLFRLGYIPRVAGDDLAGQTARLGAATMALRAGWGIKNGATNLALWRPQRFFDAKRAVALEGATYADQELQALTPALTKLRGQFAAEQGMRARDVVRAQARATRAQQIVATLPEDASDARKAAAAQFAQAKQNALSRATARQQGALWPTKASRLADMEENAAYLTRMRDQAKQAADEAAKGFQKAKQGSTPVHLGNGVYAPAAFGGQGGEYYQKLVSSDEALGQIFATNKQIVHGHLMRSFDNGGKVMSAAQDEALHATSWAHAINGQLAQDQLARRAIQGASVDDLTKWLSTPEGRIYRDRLGLKMVTNEDLANSAWHEVAHYLPSPAIRAQALTPEGVNTKFLKDSTPMAQRPDVHTGQVGQAQSRYKRAVDNVIGSWFKWAATVPADRLSRHPLFNQLYTGHLMRLKNQAVKQGAYDTTVDGVERMATAARRLALRDTRGLVFDIAHRSDVSAALRFVAPFMTATNESFQRWGRILADKPQVAGYANVFFNAPIAAGHMQDNDGNSITKDGYVYTIDSKTGKAVKTLVPKSQRYIVGRMPKFLVDSPVGVAMGVEPASGNMRLSQNSIDLVTQGDPWFHPGVGPIVQIPVNQLVKDKPRAAELARHLQILPFGPQQGGLPTQAGSFLLPSTVKNFLTAFDTSDDRYQSVKLQIMQRAAYEHENLGKPMPSAKQIAAMTRNYWLFSAGSAFLQPMATQKADKYQFYRDQYNALRRANPLTADDEFLKRFGESYFIFAQAQSKNDSGVPATVKAVELEKKYGDIMAKNPELGALVVGPEGNGPFSPEAYSYQLNTPLAPGGSEMQRSKMSADEAMQENQRRLGWAQYTKLMNKLGAQLHNRGLNSYTDKGAEDLRAMKQAYSMLLGSPTMPDGSENPFYNAAWSKDFNTLDPLKYERLIPGMEQVANSRLADDPNRSDLRVLQSYLGARQAVVKLLAQRKAGGGSNVITAQSNADLLTAWQRWVDGLVESNTNFGDLHSRYLARDLGYDGSTEAAA